MQRRRIAVLLAVLLAVGCGSKKRVIPPEQLWAEGNQAFEEEAWELAVERYKALLDQHPFDTNAEEAELRIARAHYLAGRYPEAIAALGDFERMHPTSEQLPFVEYHLGMSYVAQATTSDRDQQPYSNALAYFRNLIDRFPTSPWAEKARLRLRECREALARHESNVARYYLGQGNVRAAEARLRGLLSQYPEAEATAQALFDFAAAYERRKEPEVATLALAALVRHHPDGRLGQEARARLKGSSDADALVNGEDPAALLIARIDRMSLQPDRQAVPDTVSAYPDVGGVGGGRF